MAKTYRSVIEKQHPLVQQLRSVLDNPNASLGDLANVVRRTLAEFHLSERISKDDRGRQSGGAGAGAPLAGLTPEEIVRLREIASASSSPGRRAPKSR